MANTLYDENVGGPFGNTHMAVGMSIVDTFDGDATAVSDEEWEHLGYNLKASGAQRHRLDDRPHGDRGHARRLGAGDLRR